MAIIKTTRYHIEITNIDKNGNLNIVYPKNTVDDVYMDPKKNVTIKGKVFFYGATAVDADVQTIDVSVPGFQLVEGAHVTVKFEHGITSSNPRLRINNGIQTLTAVPIFYRNKALPSDLIKENAVVDLVYSVGSFHVSHELIIPPLSVNNTTKFYLTGVTTGNAKAYPDNNIYDNHVYVDTVEGRLCATTFLGTTVYFDTTSSYINKTDYTGNSATTTKFKTARNITVGKKTNSFDGTANIEFTLSQIDAVAKDGDEMRGDLKITSGAADGRYVLYKGNGIEFVMPTSGGFAGGISFKNPTTNTVEGTMGFYKDNHFYFGQAYNNANGTVKAATFIGNLTGTADVAKKLGTSTVGSNTKFFYLNAGTATASTATVGSGIKPMFLSSGTFTESSSTVGSSTKPVYLSSGTITASSSTVGSTTKPIYMSSGTITASNATVGSTDTPVYMTGGTITTTGKKFSDYMLNSGGTFTGAISLNVGGTDTTGSPIKQIGGTMGSNDSWRISSGATASDSGFLEIATYDNGNEPIYFRQYPTGGTARTLTLLDGSGNTILPGTLTAPNLSITSRATLNKLSLPTTGGSWISGMTLTNPSIQITTKNSSGSYHPIIGGQTYNSHIWNLGTYVDNIGFYGFYNGRTVNGTDWSFVINSSTGAVSSSGAITAPSFNGKLGTANVGSNTKFFYLNGGTATASTATVGSGTKIMYLSSGTFTASTSDVGSASKPVYMASGAITACSSTVGSATKPVYMSSGTITACTNNMMAAVSANGYYGLVAPGGNGSEWIRTTSNGLIPYQSGAKGSGHGSLGTSSWYFKDVYTDRINGANVPTFSLSGTTLTITI